jgi:hypothetical protein
MGSILAILLMVIVGSGNHFDRLIVNNNLHPEDISAGYQKNELCQFSFSINQVQNT